MRFDSYHPMINLIYFFTVIACSILFSHPVFISIGFICAFLYSLKLAGKRALLRNLLLLPCSALFALFYASYHHFGLTIIRQNIIGNNITLESFVYGLTLSFRASTVIMWFSCVHAVFCTDKVVYLFGRVSPRLALGLSLILRFIPRTRAQWQSIILARHCISLGLQDGRFLKKVHNLFSALSVIVTWIFDYFINLSDTMRARGVTLRGRTAFSIYRFDNRDRGFVVSIFFFETIVLVGFLLNQTSIHYNPRIIMNRITPFSYVFYAAYAILCTLPQLIQIFGEAKHQRLSHKAIRQSYYLHA